MINVMFCGNDKVFDGILTAILSILKRTKTEDAFNFVVLTMKLTRIKPDYEPISNAKTEFLDKVVKGYNPKNSCKKYDVTDLYESEFKFCPNESAYCSPYTLLRLFADELPEKFDKLLYLDADVMFNKDITLLYDKDIGDFEYASARDHYGKFLVHPNSINAGVLLFNMPFCEKTGLFPKARKLIKTKKLLFADQSAIFRSTTKKLMLSQRFNDQKFLHEKSTVVRHFSKRLFYFPYPHTENIKQWQVEKLRKTFRYHAFDDVLDEYLLLKEKL